MKRNFQKAFRVFTLLLLSLTFWTAICFAATPEQIFVWVSRQMHIEYAYDMPEVQFVGKQQLQSVFQDFSRRSFEEWQVNHGEEQARTIMASYLDRVVGFFHPPTQTIYVGEYLSPCLKQSVLAHEITHYFQDLIRGPIELKGYGADDRRMFREMEAYLMGNKFKDLFCNSENSPDSEQLMAFLY